MPSSPKSGKSQRHKLAAIIRSRLELDEDWSTSTERPNFFDRITHKNWPEFETAFKRVVSLGCRWDVLLTCLSRYDTYNSVEIVLESARYDSDGELSARPRTRRQQLSGPPNKDERDSIRRCLGRAHDRIRRYEGLLFELGQLDAPPSVLGPELSPDEALVYLPRLLNWCSRLLADDSFGNFRTVQNAGRLVPCVYAELVADESNTGKNQPRQSCLRLIADLIYEMKEHDGCEQAELREALKRFKLQYPELYRELKNKIRTLHEFSDGDSDGWKRLLANERVRRSWPKS